VVLDASALENQAMTGRPKMAICCVSGKSQSAHLRNRLRVLDFSASLHLTIFEQAAILNFSVR
jgi:hypothetical protein